MGSWMHAIHVAEVQLCIMWWRIPCSLVKRGRPFINGWIHRRREKNQYSVQISANNLEDPAVIRCIYLQPAYNEAALYLAQLVRGGGMSCSCRYVKRTSESSAYSEGHLGSVPVPRTNKNEACISLLSGTRSLWEATGPPQSVRNYYSHLQLVRTFSYCVLSIVINWIFE